MRLGVVCLPQSTNGRRDMWRRYHQDHAETVVALPRLPTGHIEKVLLHGRLREGDAVALTGVGRDAACLTTRRQANFTLERVEQEERTATSGAKSSPVPERVRERHEEKGRQRRGTAAQSSIGTPSNRQSPIDNLSIGTRQSQICGYSISSLVNASSGSTKYSISRSSSSSSGDGGGGGGGSSAGIRTFR